ncbi:hypothetical protein [Paraflavitalea speifideaquila]|uniref:hypothetical protein n=1 Tax=Paraflavitalea speifideaquila TaxID=3076558 RepID=UPI0028E57E9A|nr:hypothetical protein [Paraflavitalea speifideiaquila]
MGLLGHGAPFFLHASSIGGLIAGYFKWKKKNNGNTDVPLIALLPLILSRLKSHWSYSGTVQGIYFFDITANREKLWSNVTGMREMYSHFKLSTTFNFYASVWAGWIMKDIQNNILQVIKARAQQK